MTKLSEELSAAKKKESILKLEAEKIQAEAQKIAAAEAKLVALIEKEKALKLKEQRLQEEQRQISEAEAKIALEKQKQKELAEAEAQKVATEKARLAEVKRKEQELAQKQAQMQAEEQKMAVEKARLAEVKRKEQELAQKQAQMQAEAQKIAAEKARLATLARKEKEVEQAQRALAAQQKIQAQEAQSKAQTLAARQVPSRSVDNISAPSFAPQVIQPSAGNISTRNVKRNPVASSSFRQGQLKNVLDRSGLSSVSAIRQQGQGHYYWKAGGMTGKAQIASASQNMNQFVQSYIAREKKNCRGDFASLPAALSAGKTGYELACISGTQGKSASILFTQKGNEIIAITHETTADNMDAAIDARDKVASQL